MKIYDDLKKEFSKIIKFFTSIIETKNFDSEYQKYLDSDGFISEKKLSKREFYQKKQTKKYNKINKCC